MSVDPTYEDEFRAVNAALQVQIEELEIGKKAILEHYTELFKEKERLRIESEAWRSTAEQRERSIKAHEKAVQTLTDENARLEKENELSKQRILICGVRVVKQGKEIELLKKERDTIQKRLVKALENNEMQIRRIKALKSKIAALNDLIQEYISS